MQQYMQQPVPSMQLPTMLPAVWPYGAPSMWQQQQLMTPPQPPLQQPSTPPSLLVMERELRVLEAEQAVDPAKAPRAGRICGLKEDIMRYRRKRRL